MIQIEGAGLSSDTYVSQARGQFAPNQPPAPSEPSRLHPQVTYSGDGVFLTLGLVCSGKASTHASLAENFRSAIYAFSKTAIYAPHSSGSVSAVNAAVYVVAKAWYRSVSVSSSVVLGDSLNNFAQPARPQTLEDVFNGPYFVQKVRSCVLAVRCDVLCCAVCLEPSAAAA
jgi:hypothetical protein